MVDPTDSRIDADAAIARVLAAESAAVQSIEQARAQTTRIAEAARAEAHALAERTERRIRRITAAFEARLDTQLAAIAREAQSLDAPAPLSDAERAALHAAVQALAAELVGDAGRAAPTD